MCSVRVCMRVHTLTPTYTPTRVKNRADTDNFPIFSSVINNSPRQATSVLIDQLNPLTLCSQRWMNTLRIHECICTPCDERVRKCVRWCSQHLFNVYTCTCIVLTTPVAMHAYSPQECTCTCACAPMQRCKSFFALEAITNLSSILGLREHRASCRLPPALLLSRRNSCLMMIAFIITPGEILA